jgi:hypothetical protein
MQNNINVGQQQNTKPKLISAHAWAKHKRLTAQGPKRKHKTKWQQPIDSTIWN